ncbi:MAG: SDR family NAD(P)-dependent oxidoreductase [Deltaproteobacteria bacterium]|jgi:short-subunit dehydrogenase|nr:SDR family NAD(P)-dependent oxidoreductase [Deltaproteobacteria bacterium]MBW2533209.1 SDR family NAD(P)-dependent oxidoreductase [Deltaproteobacteria bacterium]
MSLVTTYGPWALVTGAAHGLGKAFAAQLAARGLSLVLLDLDGEANDRVGAELRAEHGIETHCERVDVSQADLPAQAGRLAAAHEIGLLVANAGISTIGAFLDAELDDHLRVLDTNCRGTLVLSHILGRAMAARGRGAIVIVSSVSAMTGTPVVAHYAATKAYGLELASGLWAELEGSGIDVLAACPGLTHTRGTEIHPPNRAAAPLVPMMEAAEVAESTVRALEARRGPAVVPGWQNRASSWVMSRVLPRRLSLRLLRSTMHRLYPSGGATRGGHRSERGRPPAGPRSPLR